MVTLGVGAMGCGGSGSEGSFSGPLRVLALNHQSACVADASGELYCWGNSLTIPGMEVSSGSDNICVDPFVPANGGGPLDDCITNGSLRVPTDVRFKKVSRQTAIADDGQLYMWPYWEGLPTTCDPQNEVCVPGVGPAADASMRFKDVAEFDGGWCGLTTDGAGYCRWRRYDPTGTQNTLWDPPIAFGAGQTFEKISVSGNALVVVDAAGKAFRATLGYVSGTEQWMVTSPSPWEPDRTFTEVEVNHRYAIPSQVAGGTAVCGLTDGGTVVCDGMNEMGQRGNGTVSPIGMEDASPTAVAGLPPMAGLAVGNRHYCAVAANGDVYCWGRSNEGQTGHAMQIECALPEPGLTHYCSPTPAKVTDIPPMKRIEASIQFTCGETMDGEVWCWGLNDLGQIGEPGANGKVVVN